jgi:hypothetical protein
MMTTMGVTYRASDLGVFDLCSTLQVQPSIEPERVLGQRR